ncbi:MAG: hypothetical protein ABI406_07600 [Ktedonobacteraceae bacterium]
MIPVTIIIIAAASSSLMIIIARIRQKSHSSVTRAERIDHLTERGVASSVATHIMRGDRLNAVKAYREESGLGLREATTYIDEVSKF